MTTYRNPSGWSITYSGGRLADIYTPEGSCVDCVQARPWDWERNPSDQEEYAVTEELLASLLSTYLGADELSQGVSLA